MLWLLNQLQEPVIGCLCRYAGVKAFEKSSWSYVIWPRAFLWPSLWISPSRGTLALEITQCTKWKCGYSKAEAGRYAAKPVLLVFLKHASGSCTCSSFSQPADFSSTVDARSLACCGYAPACFLVWSKLWLLGLSSSFMLPVATWSGTRIQWNSLQRVFLFCSSGTRLQAHCLSNEAESETLSSRTGPRRS